MRVELFGKGGARLSAFIIGKEDKGQTYLRRVGDDNDRFTHLRVLIAGSALGQLLHLLGLWLANLWSPAIMTVPSLLYGLNQTAKNHLLQQDFTDAQRATLGSVVAFAGSLVFLIAAVGAGMIADVWGPVVALTTLVSIHLLVVPIYVGLFRSR